MSVSAVEAARARRRVWRRPLAIVLALVVVAGLILVALAGLAALSLLRSGSAAIDDAAEHFKYGSIGSEPASGLPRAVWDALPALYPDVFEGRDDYAAFGFKYEEGRELPVGFGTRTHRGVELVWFNCAVCHASTVRAAPDAEPELILAMPAHTLELERFIAFILSAAADERLGPEILLADIEEAEDLGIIDRLVWRFAVMPRLREELIKRRSRVLPLLARQPAWGPGRVDTFNPYKVLEFGVDANAMPAEEVVGASDFPSVFLQGPRDGMQLHWDGNNRSLAERNLSAAIGAGVTPDTVDHDAIERVATWLSDLAPPPSPHRPERQAVNAGRALYMESCASCHGYQGRTGYVFEGDRLGRVTPIDEIGTDRARLDSYTHRFNRRQREELFAGTPYHFRHFTKTDGYANAPLDALWLRAPYLHNGSVPTLAALLAPPAERPVAFERGSNVLDGENGGFLADACDPATYAGEAFCYDTRLTGNANGGHLYGTELSPADKADLLAYLMTF